MVLNRKPGIAAVIFGYRTREYLDCFASPFAVETATGDRSLAMTLLRPKGYGGQAESGPHVGTPGQRPGLYTPQSGKRLREVHVGNPKYKRPKRAFNMQPRHLSCPDVQAGSDGAAMRSAVNGNDLFFYFLAQRYPFSAG